MRWKKYCIGRATRARDDAGAQGVPAEVVSQLMLRFGPSGKLLPPERLKPGDRVRLTRGPFTNLVAEIETIEPDRRVWALLDIMGGRTRVAVDIDQIRAV